MLHRIVVVMIAVVALVGCGAVAPPVVTMDEYTQIREGMTYSQVVSIIGASGEEVASNVIEGVPGVMPTMRTTMYQWVNADGSNMNAMFQNGELIQKAQFGLR